MFIDDTKYVYVGVTQKLPIGVSKKLGAKLLVALTRSSWWRQN